MQNTIIVNFRLARRISNNQFCHAEKGELRPTPDVKEGNEAELGWGPIQVHRRV